MVPYGVDTPLMLGVMEIGVFTSLVMFGVVALQGYVYFQNCGEDRAWLKWLVGFLLFFELSHSVASCEAVYYFTIIQAGVPEVSKKANTYSLSLTPLFETIITAMVQVFFAYRIRLLSGRTYPSLICYFLAFLRFVGGIAISILSFLDVPLEPDYFHLTDTYSWLITVALNVGVVLDILITVLLCVYIRQLYTPYSLPRSEELINRLVAWTIQTGLITSLTSVAVVITFQTMKHNFIWLALYTFLAKLYSNSLLASLNARPGHREIIRVPRPKLPDTTPTSTPPRTPTPRPVLTIQINRTTEVASRCSSIIDILPHLNMPVVLQPEVVRLPEKAMQYGNATLV